jgi:hypothetical protein
MDVKVDELGKAVMESPVENETSVDDLDDLPEC